MARRGENIYKRKDGRWEGRFIRGRTPTGKAKYGYVYARTYAGCRDKLRGQRQRGPQAETPSATVSLRQAAEWFLLSKRDSLKPSSYGRYAFVIEHHILPWLGTLSLQELTAERISAFFRCLRSKGLSEKSARDVGVLLKSILKQAEQKWQCGSPASGARLPPCKMKKADTFTEYEVAMLAKYIISAPDMTGLCVLLVLNTGLRLGEVCALKKSDIILSSGVLRVRRAVQRIKSGTGTQLVLQEPKSASSRRSIPIPADMLALLANALAEVPEDAFLLTGNDRPMEPRTMQYRYKSLLNRCGIEYRNFHTLRHTYATRCMERNVDIKSISEMLGHSDVRITLSTYIHSSMEHKQRAVQRICFLPQRTVQELLSPSNPSSARWRTMAPQGAERGSFANCI